MENDLTQASKSDEKYITIEYQTWLDKYLPMEEAIADLRKQIAQEQARNSITVFLGTGHIEEYQIGSDFYDRRLAVAQVLRIKEWSLTDIITPEDENIIQAMLINYLTGKFSATYNIMSEVQLRAMNDERRKVIGLMDQGIEGLKTQIEKIKRVPRFVRWLFGIKIIE